MSSHSDALDSIECEPSEPWVQLTDDTSSLQLARLLGSGRHGMVFLGARDVGGARTSVAVKVPSTPHGLENERRALLRFRHPHVIALLDGPLSNGALVLELCDRGTLADLLREETLPVGKLADLLTDLIPALQRIHEQGWIHGDISPSNIGLRSSGGPTLLDFATARPSDGSAVEEGTAEFAGPLRQADPRLDIRALTATALRALGQPDRWDHRKRHVHQRLTDLVARCDADESVAFSELSRIVDSMRDTIPADLVRRDLLGGGPDVTPTRAFGPRPTGRTPQENVASRRGLTLKILAAAIIMLVVATAIEMSDLPARRSHAPVAGETASLVVEQSAAETLALASASWNAQAGVVAVLDANGDATHFAAGRAGDVAAIADWSCDGNSTLGVFRPSTNVWFEFDSWDEHAQASPTPLDGGSTLWVSTDGGGCSVPVLR